MFLNRFIDPVFMPIPRMGAGERHSSHLFCMQAAWWALASSGAGHWKEGSLLHACSCAMSLRVLKAPLHVVDYFLHHRGDSPLSFV